MNNQDNPSAAPTMPPAMLQASDVPEKVLAEGKAQAEAAERQMATQRTDYALVDGLGAMGVPSQFNQLWRMAKVFADSHLVPEAFRGSPADCMIVLQMAARHGMDPFQFLQKMYVVHGRPGMESQLLIGIMNSSGVIKGRMRWEMTGERDTDGWTCTCSVTDKETGDEYKDVLTWATVMAYGWVNKNGSFWKIDPEMMFRYRTAARLCRTYYPEVLSGMYTKDELEDIPAPIVLNPAPEQVQAAFGGDAGAQSRTEALMAANSRGKQPVQEAEPVIEQPQEAAPKPKRKPRKLTDPTPEPPPQQPGVADPQITVDDADQGAQAELAEEEAQREFGQAQVDAEEGYTPPGDPGREQPVTADPVEAVIEEELDAISKTPGEAMSGVDMQGWRNWMQQCTTRATYDVGMAHWLKDDISASEAQIMEITGLFDGVAGNLKAIGQ